MGAVSHEPHGYKLLLESMRGNDCKDKITTRSLAPACAPTRTSRTLQKRPCREGVVPVLYSVKDNAMALLPLILASQWHHSTC